MTRDESIEILVDRIDRLVCAGCGANTDVSKLEPFSMFTCPQCGAQMPVPVQLGDYLLVKEMGKGAMGTVYQAYDTILKRSVAIKVMRRSLGEDQDFVDKFLHEAQALAALNHRNVVQIHTCGKVKGQPYIVMELVFGGRFDEWMREAGALDEELVLHVALDVANGLQAAGSIGMVHGDIKPQNILFDKENTAKVVDFGLARFKGDAPRTGEVWGTPYYVAPEVARGAVPDQQADIYSLGATLYQALAGQPPFNKKTAIETVVARFQEPVPSLKAARPDLHDVTVALVHRMLEADRYKRFPTYTSLLADMNEAQKVLISARTPKEKKHHAHRKKLSGVWPLVMSLLTILVLLGAAGGLLWSIAHKRQEEVESRPPRPAGPVRMKFIDGKLVPVPLDTDGDASSGAAPAALAPGTVVQITTLEGRGADAYIQGPGGPTDSGGNSFGEDKILWVKAGNDPALHLARKIYLRFDLAPLAGSPVADGSLSLVAIPAGKNRAAGEYRLKLWGLRDGLQGEDWSDKQAGALTWHSAPGNDRASPSAMSADFQLLAEITVPANPAAGEAMVLSNADSVSPDALLAFIRADTDGAVTFALTANDASEQRAGWKFGSREYRTLKPPTLILKTGAAAR